MNKVLKTDEKGLVVWSKWHSRRPKHGGVGKLATHQEARKFLVGLGFEEVEHKYTEKEVLVGGDCIGGIKCHDEWETERSAYTHLRMISGEIVYNVWIRGVWVNQTYLTVGRSDYPDQYWKMGLNVEEQTRLYSNSWLKLEHLWDVVRVFPKDLANQSTSDQPITV